MILAPVSPFLWEAADSDDWTRHGIARRFPLSENAAVFQLGTRRTDQKPPPAIVDSLPGRGRQSMKRKPDLLWVLVILFGLGVVTTGYTQSLWDRQGEVPVQVTKQP